MRWVREGNEAGNQETPEVDAFLAELESVCRKHKFSLSHEDSQGSFIVTSFNENLLEWLKAANFYK